MQQEKAWLLPHLGDQLIHVIGGRRAGARLDALGQNGTAQQTVFLVVDQFAFLALLDGFDRQAQLFSGLVIGFAVEIRYPRMHVEHGIDGGEHVFARIGYVVDKRLRKFALVAI